jgi:hypothetical protein
MPTTIGGVTHFDEQLLAGQFRAGNVPPALNVAANFRLPGTRNLFVSCEERETILVTSDLPLPPERNCSNSVDSLRYVFAHFDLAGIHQHNSGRKNTNLKLKDEWYFEGTNLVGNVLMDSPKQTGYQSLVLPSIIPSVNIRCRLRRKQYNFDTNKYDVVEVPLLQTDIDQFSMRLTFTLQL